MKKFYEHWLWHVFELFLSVIAEFIF